MSRKIQYQGKEYTINGARELFLNQLRGINAPRSVLELADLVVKKQGKGGIKHKIITKYNTFRQILNADGRVSEDKIWAMFKWGRHETLGAAWYLRSRGEPENYMYISYELDVSGIAYYVLKGIGPNPPEGYALKRVNRKIPREVKN